MTYLMLLLLLTSPQVTAGNLLLKQAFPPKKVTIHAHVDFGPAGKPLIEKEVTVPEGATPKEALKKISAVTGGAACCHPEEVKGIDGVLIDPLKNRWWKLALNGTTKNASPHKSYLKAGDRMEWVYFEDKQ